MIGKMGIQLLLIVNLCFNRSCMGADFLPNNWKDGYTASFSGSLPFTVELFFSTLSKFFLAQYYQLHNDVCNYMFVFPQILLGC